MGYLTDVNSLQDWANAPVLSEFETLPDGNYIATIDKVLIFEANATQNYDSVVYEMTVCDGDKTGTRFKHIIIVRDQRAFSLIKREMKVLNCTIPTRPIDTPLSLQKAYNKPLRVHTSNREYNGKTYFNVYIDGYYIATDGKTINPLPVQQQTPQPNSFVTNENSLPDEIPF